MATTTIYGDGKQELELWQPEQLLGEPHPALSQGPLEGQKMPQAFPAPSAQPYR